jgi:hypothetical protein
MGFFMAIGFAPLFPLDRVIPDPNARLDRFGEGGYELFGKPLVTSVPDYVPSQPAWAVGGTSQILDADSSAMAGSTSGSAATPGALVDLTV